MTVRTKEVQLNPVFDLMKYVLNAELVTISLGIKNEICVLALNNKPDYIEQKGLGIFAKVQPDNANSYKVFLFKNSEIQEINLAGVKWNFHFIQSLKDDKILLVSARSRYYGKNNYDNNAKVYNYDGILINEFLLGDGIQNLKVTADNTIWTGYFDEGIFGNYGWKEPIGYCGLRAWDINGNPLYRYSAPDNEKHICDCYAMNVISSEEVWFYFYTCFNLARYKNGKLNYWETDISGSNGFLISQNFVFFRGGYDNSNVYSLYEIPHVGNKLKKVCDYVLTDENGDVLIPDEIDYRSSCLILRKGYKVYLMKLDEIFE